MELLIIGLLIIIAGVTLYYLFAVRSAANREQIAIRSENAALNMTLDAERRAIVELKDKMERADNDHKELIRQNAQLKAVNDALTESSTKIKDEITALQAQTKDQFKIIAAEILEDKSKRFTEANKTNLDTILAPFKTQIEGFEKLVKESYETEGKERSALKGVVEAMKMANEQITQEARNLTQALKGDSKAQGCWGEMILSSILENSGLTKGVQYDTEATLRDDDGVTLRNTETDRRMRPDAVVRFPGERVMIVDAKVSLTASVRYMDAATKALSDTEAAAHVRSVKSHIDELSRKGYAEYSKTLEFVMMFIPNESAYMLAIKTDPDLWKYAYDRNIMLVSPNTLIIALKMCSDLWQQDARNRNTDEIARQGGALYDKFVGFVDDLLKIKNGIDGASKQWESAMSKLDLGKGSLTKRAAKLQSLGVPVTKQLPSLDKYTASDAQVDDAEFDEEIVEESAQL